MYLFQPIVDSTARVSVWDLHSTKPGDKPEDKHLHSTMYLFQLILVAFLDTVAEDVGYGHTGYAD